MRLTDQAICLRQLDWSETSQVVALLTARHGQVRALAKGAKRTSPSAVARFSGGLEMLTRGEASLVTRPGRDLAGLVEWNLQADHHHLRTRLQPFQLACYAADLAHHLLPPHQPAPHAYHALAQLLPGLNAPPEQHHPQLLLYQWTLLDEAGYRPELERDVQTDNPLPDRQAYHFITRLGGFSISPAHPDEKLRVRAQTLQLLRQLARDHELPPDTSPDIARRANQLLCIYAQAILEQHLPTATYLLANGH